MSSILKRLFYQTSKILGLFYVARHLTRKGLRVLCYHGISLDDEHRWRPGLFIESAQFYRRLSFLAKHRFPILTLEQALLCQRENNLPPCGTVITIDDGFYSTFAHMIELLQQFRFPATLYVTSYYCEKETPIFRLAVDYLFWKTEKSSLNLSDLDVVPYPEPGELPLSDSTKADLVDFIVAYGETQCDQATRNLISERLAECLNVDYARLTSGRALSLINRRELTELEGYGIAVELHTHRHTFPSNYDAAKKELEDNKRALEPLLGRKLTHFCYPSGEWSPAHWKVLEDFGIKTATTCDVGLNFLDSQEYAIKRILDSSGVSQIEFEAEMFGFAELLRSVRSRLRGKPPNPALR